MPNVVIDVAAMRHSYTGVYFYCLHLLKAMKEQKEKFPFMNISLFAPKQVNKFFYNDYQIRNINKLHKYFIFAKNKYDIWHTSFQRSKFDPGHFKGIRILTIHDLNFLHENISRSQKDKINSLIGQRIQNMDKIIAISHFVKKDIIDHYDIEPSKIEVIYNGCNISAEPIFAPPMIRPLCPFFFTIGFVEDKKNFKVLPAMLLDNTYELVIAGKITNKNYASEIMQEARKLGVHDRVKIVETISEEEKNWYLNNCLAFAFPSKAEGFGLPVIEAMHFGKPVILSPVTSLPEIGGDEAYYFDDFDPDAISAITSYMLNDFNEDRSSASKLRASSFSWDKTALQYYKLYCQLLNIDVNNIA